MALISVKDKIPKESIKTHKVTNGVISDPDDILIYILTC